MILQGKFCIIKDCAKIEDNTILPPNTVVPALAVFCGSPGLFQTGAYIPEVNKRAVPGRFVKELSESTPERVEAMTKQYYNRFVPTQDR